MTSAIKILLKEHLDDLEKKDFENFQWYLLQRKKEGKRPILRSDMEGADTKQTVDKMVQVYGEDGALNITVYILMDINNNDMAMKLMEKAKLVEQQSHERETQRDAEMTTQKEVKVQSENYGERSQDDPSGGHRNDSESYQKSSSVGDPVNLLQLKNATREGTVDKMVQVCGKDGAAETVDILTRMNHNDLAIRLTEAQIDRNVEQQLHEREPQRNADWTQDLSCSVCHDIFTEPVALHCGHSFCRTCVHKDWRGNIIQKCPLCQDVTHTEPQTNFTRKSLIEKYTRTSPVDPPGGHRNASLHQSYQTPSNIREKREPFQRVSETQKICRLQDFRTEMERTQNALPNPLAFPRAEINVSNHVGNLCVTAVEKLLNTVKPRPAPRPYMLGQAGPSTFGVRSVFPNISTNQHVYMDHPARALLHGSSTAGSLDEMSWQTEEWSWQSHS